VSRLHAMVALFFQEQGRKLLCPQELLDQPSCWCCLALDQRNTWTSSRYFFWLFMFVRIY